MRRLQHSVHFYEKGSFGKGHRGAPRRVSPTVPLPRTTLLFALDRSDAGAPWCMLKSEPQAMRPTP